MSDRHIVAFGGGGFVSTPASPLLPYVLSLARRTPPRVCHVPTASGDPDSSVAAFYRNATRLGCVPSDLPLFRRGDEDPRELLLAQDVIWVGGGNTANLLAVWRLHGIDAALREAWEAGVVLAGTSAGMLCWFEASITDSFGPRLAALHDGLGFLRGSACPHYDAEARRRPVYRAAIANGLAPGYAADNDVALHFAGEQLVEAVSARPDARAYRLELEADEVVERPLPTRVLADAEGAPGGAPSTVGRS